MSLTSCFRYIIELPPATLNSMIQGILEEADGAGIQTSVHQENVPVSGFTATVDAQLADPETSPPTLILTSVDLGLILHLHMNLQVQVNEVANLDAIVYGLEFDFPGQFQKVVTPAPPVLNMTFPGLTPAVLNLNVTGGDVQLTVALIDPIVHQLYQQNPGLAHQVHPDTPTGLPSPDDLWLITVDVYDDQLGSPGFRGRISVEIPDQNHIKLNLPGHLKAQSIAATRIDSDTTTSIIVPVQRADGMITVQLSQVTGADVTVVFASPNLYTIAATGSGLLQNQVAAAMNALPDPVQDTPKQQDVKDLIAAQLVQYGDGLLIPMLKTMPPANPGDMDLTTFVPTTLGGQALALQIEPQPVPCDVPDFFVVASQFAVSVDKERCDAMIQPVIAAENGRTRNIQGHDVTVSGLSATLSDPGDHGVAAGHIWISGEATVHIDCWPDAHINFSGPITITPETQADGSVRFHPHAGQFTADDPCCASVDPAQIGQLIEQDDYPPIAGLPSNFTGVGMIQITANAADIFAAGIVVRGDLAVATTHSLEANVIQHNMFWHNEPPGGG